MHPQHRGPKRNRPVRARRTGRWVVRVGRRSVGAAVGLDVPLLVAATVAVPGVQLDTGRGVGARLVEAAARSHVLEDEGAGRGVRGDGVLLAGLAGGAALD